MIYKVLHRKLKIEEYESNNITGVNSGAPEWYTYPAPLVSPIVLLTVVSNPVINQERTEL